MSHRGGVVALIFFPAVGAPTLPWTSSALNELKTWVLGIFFGTRKIFSALQRLFSYCSMCPLCSLFCRLLP